MGPKSWSNVRLFSSLLIMFLTTKHASSAPTVEPLVAIGENSTTDSATTTHQQTEISTETTEAETYSTEETPSTTALPDGDYLGTEPNQTETSVAPETSSSTSVVADDLSTLEPKNSVTSSWSIDDVIGDEQGMTSTSDNAAINELPTETDVISGSTETAKTDERATSGITETLTLRSSASSTSYPVWRPFPGTTRSPSTTVSGLEWFANTPIEGLINATSLARDDLTTLASLLFDRQTTTAPTTTTTEGWPNVHNPFFFDRHSPGSTCVYKGRQYANGQSLDQEDPCHFCVCVNGYVDCYSKNCPPAPEGCLELDYDGVCARSLYLCSIPKKGEPLPFSVNKRKRRELSYSSMTCDILGVVYKVGELVGVASDPCMECRCALDSLYCSPKCCFNPLEVASDPAKNSRANDVVQWQPVLSHPLKHLRYDFQNL